MTNTMSTDLAPPERARRLTPRLVPPVTLLLAAALWVVFAAESVQKGGSESSATLFRFGATTSTTLYHGELWRLVASAFVHRGLAHIAGNTLVLLALGSVAELLFDRPRYLALYLAAGVGGAIATVLTSGPAALGVGASGALYGLAGALLVTPWRAGLGVTRQTARDLRIALGVGVVVSLLLGGRLGGSLATHAGGLVTGALLGLALRLASRRDPDGAARATALVSEVIVAGAALLLLTWFAPRHPAPLDEAAALVKDGIARLQRGDYQGAVDADTRALRIAPGFATAYDRRGVAHYSMGDYKGASADETRALALDKRDVLAYNLRGLVRLRQGDAVGAVADETRALRIDPKLAPAYYDRGIAHATLHDTRAALADLTHAATLFAGQRNYRAYAQVQTTIAQLPRP